ncbi:MAG: ATP phosphoribosyltransferase [Pyrinomonadaceae bacterium]|nr:ATP phosphoribosyltransferase [Pyrinomonadaceae bacterium]MCX7639490.1 ATP phosphoribosyltransferase [Pyrinomonadaceae bacterium]MDW8304459.1 ATP phosphoribosyltransferase [Acidobacteriota bacterium]
MRKLKMALQKSGRLSEPSAELLRDCGIYFSNGFGKLKSEAENFPLEIFFLRDDDIPEYVADGVADAGIVGENVLAEKSDKRIKVVEKLGFGRCRLSIAVPKTFSYESILDLQGKRIATTYPRILDRFLRMKEIEAEIHTISGSVEIAPSIGLADAVCDLVSSGSTLFTNGLKEVEVVMNSEAVMIARADMDNFLCKILEKLIFRIRAVRQAKENKYILLNVPNDKLESVCRLIPGMKSPTVMPLAKPGWSSVHSVIAAEDFWEVVEKLKNEGAEGILVISIDQMIR